MPPPVKSQIFEFYPGRVMGISGAGLPGEVVPAKYRLLRIPLWVVPAVLLLPWLLMRSRGLHSSTRAH
jgi:hypothetical protein